MSKKIKLLLVTSVSITMLVSWLFIYVSGSQGELSNNLWQVGMAISAFIFGLLGLITAKQWGWFKSNVGRAVFFISLGLLFWSIGQAYWTYFLFADPSDEVPQSYAMDIILFSVIPIWTYGVISLSKATGAKYGLKAAGSKLIAVFLVAFLSIFSYITLVMIARDGVLFSEDKSTWQSLFDLVFPIGDAVLLSLSVLIFVYSWHYLGGRFKKSILLILTSFVALFLADFGFSFTDGNGTYYNGNIVDLMFIVMVALMGLGLAHLDPRTTKIAATSLVPTEPKNDVPVVDSTINNQPLTDQQQVADVNDQPLPQAVSYEATPQQTQQQPSAEQSEQQNTDGMANNQTDLQADNYPAPPPPDQQDPTQTQEQQ
jgi:hypothetical protein